MLLLFKIPMMQLTLHIEELPDCFLSSSACVFDTTMLEPFLFLTPFILWKGLS
jgi:hypothetical protein